MKASKMYFVILISTLFAATMGEFSFLFLWKDYTLICMRHAYTYDMVKVPILHCRYSINHKIFWQSILKNWYH